MEMIGSQTRTIERGSGQTHRALLLSLLVSLGILFGGIFWTWRVGLQANALDHRLYHAQEGLEALHNYAQKTKGGTR